MTSFWTTTSSLDRRSSAKRCRADQAVTPDTLTGRRARLGGAAYPGFSGLPKLSRRPVSHPLIVINERRVSESGISFFGSQAKRSGRRPRLGVALLVDPPCQAAEDAAALGLAGGRLGSRSPDVVSDLSGGIGAVGVVVGP